MGLGRGKRQTTDGATRRSSAPAQSAAAMSAGAAAGRRSVRAQLHSIASWVPDVEAPAVPLRAPEVGGAHVDLEAAGCGELVEIDVVDDQRDVVDVHARAL